MLSNRFLYDSNLRQVFDPALQDYKIPDYDYRMLRNASKIHYDVEYLSVAKNYPAFPVEGVILGNQRLLINLCCRKDDQGDTDTSPWINVMFILNTCSPTTFLSKHAIEKLGGSRDIPTLVNIHSDSLLWAYPASPQSQFTELNILGMDFLTM